MNLVKRFILLFFCGTNFLLAQRSISYNDKLFATAKVWGFLKYYHPNVAKGKFDWDKQLFEILPLIKKANTKDEFSKICIAWIESLGKINNCSKCLKLSKQDYFDKNFDLSWMQDGLLISNELHDKLKFIEHNRALGKQYYASIGKGAQNVKIENEKVYEDFTWDNRNLRILTLFRYWNNIEYFFPYKYQMDEDWNAVLKEMIPKFLNVNSELDYHLSLLELVVKIDDSHAGFFTEITKEYFGKKYIAAYYKIIDDKAVVLGFYNDSLALVNDIQIGDVFTKVNGESISQIINGNDKYIHGSNQATKLRNNNYSIFNGSTDSVEVEYLRNNKVQSKKVGRYFFEDFNYKRPVKDKWRILENNIGYVNLGSLERDDVSGMMDSLKNTKAIIFDIRNYPKNTLYSIVSYLNSEPKEFVNFTRPVLNYPGRYTYEKYMKVGKAKGLKYANRVVLLVNEFTQSFGEFTAMCLQTGDQVTTIGSQTAGADGNVSKMELPGGLSTWISGIGVFYPDGTETQRNGIKLNYEVKPSISGILEGRDEVLEMAIQHIEAGN